MEVEYSGENSRGIYCAPDHGGTHPAVLALGGSDGGTPRYFPDLLVPEGFACLALAYWGTPETQAWFTEIPLERIEQGLRWLIDRSETKTPDGRVALVGASRGAELALLIAATFPEMVGPVVAYTPSCVIWQGVDLTLPRQLMPMSGRWSSGVFAVNTDLVAQIGFGSTLKGSSFGRDIMSGFGVWSALACLLFCSLAAGQQVDSDFAATDGEADGFSPDARPFEYSAEVESLIREAGCSDEDEQCKRAVAVRYALRLPEGFSREPDCVANTVCVSERQTIGHDDFVAILELVSPQIQPDWVNITMREVMMGIVLVTAESDRTHAQTFDFIDGGEFLVEKKPPMTGNWSILRGQVYHRDLRR